MRKKEFVFTTSQVGESLWTTILDLDIKSILKHKNNTNLAKISYFADKIASLMFKLLKASKIS